MNLLWLALALLLLPALWIVMLPLRQARHVHDAQQAYEAEARDEAQNIAVYRRRLASLEQARTRGDIDDRRFEESRLELDRSLLEDTESRHRAPLRAAKAGRWIVPVAMVALVAVSLFWYQREGAQDDLTLYAIQQEVMTSPDGSMGLLVERLEAQIERQPDNPKLWLALFPLYRDSGRFDEAIHALDRLIALEGRRPDLLAQLAQMKFFAAERSLTADVQALVDETLKKDPRQPTVLGMLGIAAFESGGYQEAIDHWRRAIAGFDDEASAQALRNGIAVAQQRLGVTPERQDENVAATGPSLRVQVSLDEALAAEANPQDTVFVVARDAAGELPPLAVKRASVADLPLEVTLSDADAMAPSARLSQVDEVTVKARVSASGQAMAQAGDLLGESRPIALGAQESSVAIAIDRVVD